MKSDNQGDKEETFIQASRRGGDGQPVEKTRGKAAAGEPREVADGGMGKCNS